MQQNGSVEKYEIYQADDESKSEWDTKITTGICQERRFCIRPEEKEESKKVKK